MLPIAIATRLGAAVRYAAFSLASALVILGLAEGALRLLAPPPAARGVDRPSWMDDEAYALFRSWTEAVGIELSDVGDLEGWRWDPRLRWMLKPNLDMRVHNIFLDPKLGSEASWRLRTNSQGFRTPEFQIARSPGVVRVVVIGDSNSMGWLLDEEDAYARRLEDHLARRLDRDVEVINLAISGHTTFGCRVLLEEIALPLQPDALVVSCGANDDQPMASSDADYAGAHRGWLGRVRRWLAGLRLVTMLQGLRPGPDPTLVPRVTAAESGDNWSRMFALARENGIPAVFLRVCCCSPPRMRQLARAVGQNGTPVLATTRVLDALSDPAVRAEHADELERIRSWYPEAEWERSPWLVGLFRDRCHLNPLGADLVAEALADRLAPRVASERGRPATEPARP